MKCQRNCIQETIIEETWIPKYLRWADDVYSLAVLSTFRQQPHNLKKKVLIVVIEIICPNAFYVEGG